MDDVRAKKGERTAADGDEKPIGRSSASRRQPAKDKIKTKDIITGDVLNNSKLSRWYPVIAWCVLLIFIYMGVHFNYQRLQRIEIQQRIILNEQRSRAVIFSSMRMNASRHSRIVDEVKRRGLPLEESTLPPKIVEKNKN